MVQGWTGAWSGLADPERLVQIAAAAAPDPVVDRALAGIVEELSRTLRAPIALLSLVTPDGQRFRGCLGFVGEQARGTPLRQSLCRLVVVDDAPLVVDDARSVPVLAASGAVRDLGVVAYAGFPVRVGGHTLGALCAIDRRPRAWTPPELRTLRDLTAVSEQLLQRRATGRLAPPLRSPGRPAVLAAAPAPVVAPAAPPAHRPAPAG